MWDIKMFAKKHINYKFWNLKGVGSRLQSQAGKENEGKSGVEQLKDQSSYYKANLQQDRSVNSSWAACMGGEYICEQQLWHSTVLHRTLW